MKQEMITFINLIENEIYDLCKYLYTNPEESYKEEKASKYICALLEKYNFNITNNYLNIENSFKATYGNGHPKICYLCEYDSVKDKGHITGHNALTSISVAASLSLSTTINKIGGSVVLIGCPGEYLGGTKNIMTRQGAFDDIDIVMECHPHINTCESGTSKAIIALKVTYSGTSGLAFLNQNTYSSLDALLLNINIVNSLSKSFPEDVTLNYIISKGGYSPLLIPDECEAQFYIRAKDTTTAEFIEGQLRDISCHVSKLTGINGNTSLYEPPNEELITNKVLNRLFNNNLKESGIINIDPPKNIDAGLSIGIVSKKVPCIHPYISMIDTNKAIKYGTKEFANCTLDKTAFNNIKKSALALALTGSDIIAKEHLLSEIRTEFHSNK